MFIMLAWLLLLYILSIYKLDKRNMKNVTEFKAVVVAKQFGGFVVNERATEEALDAVLKPILGDVDFTVTKVQYSSNCEFRVYFRAPFYANSLKTTFVSSDKNGVMDVSKLTAKATEFAQAAKAERARYDAKYAQMEQNDAKAAELNEVAKAFGMTVEPRRGVFGGFEVTFTGNYEKVSAFLASMKK